MVKILLWCNSIAACIVLFFILSKPAAGQNTEAADSLKLHKMMPKIVVTASRLPQVTGLSGRNIGVIPASVIQKLPVHSIDDVLRYVSSVDVQSRGAFGAQSDFSLRGSTFSQVLVLVDGMRLNNPLTAHYNADIPVAPSEIKRIEILHGPASAQYGADAMGGVINIITKTFDQQKHPPHTNADIKAGYGQYNLKMGQVGFTHYNNNYRIGGGGNWIKTAGQPLGKNYKDRLNIGTVSLSGSIRPAKGWSLAARTAYDNRDYNAKHFFTVSPLDNAKDHVKTWWNQLRAIHHAHHQITTLEASFEHNIDRYVFNSQTPANHHLTHFFDLQLYRQQRLSKQWKWTYGAQTANRFINSTDRGRHTNWHYAGFTTLQWRSDRPLTLTGSLRLDHDANYGTELMPQLSASYALQGWVIRASAGRSIRAPSYTEQYISTGLAGPISGGRNIGNPGLNAERSWSGEAGFDVLKIPGVRISVTGFLRNATNLIDYVQTNSQNIPDDNNLQPNTYYLYAENFNRVLITGTTMNISANKKLANSWILQSKLNYTFNNIDNNKNVASKYLSNYTHHLINGMIALEKGPYEIILTGLWKLRHRNRAKAIGAYKKAGYIVWNMKADYKIYKNFALGIEAKNIFDNHYQDILGARMPGRWIAGKISWNFGG
jgi:iron complex outermembrane receptor protein